MNLIKLKKISKKTIIISGTNRSGKSLISPIVSSLKNVNHFIYNYDLERVLQLNFLKKIDNRSFFYLFNKFASNVIYEKTIGRSINMIKDDYSSIFKYGNSIEILSKISQSPPTKNKLLRSVDKSYHPFFIHNALFFYNNISKVFSHLKFIHMVRDPVEVIYSWYQKKIFSKNFTTNLSIESVTYKNKNMTFPYWIKNLKYQPKNDMDEVFLSYQQANNKNLNSFKKYKNKKNILIVDYRNILSDPKKNISRIEKFLKTDVSKKTSLILKKEKCPRYFDKKDYDKKVYFIEQKISNKLKKDFKKEIKLYKLFIGEYA